MTRRTNYFRVSVSPRFLFRWVRSVVNVHWDGSYEYTIERSMIDERFIASLLRRSTFFLVPFSLFFPPSLFFVFGLPGENVFGKWKPIWRKIRLKVLAWVICVASFLFQYAVPYFKVICWELSDLCISVKKRTIFHTILKSPRLFQILRYTCEQKIHSVNLEHDSLETFSLLIWNAEYLRK